MFWSPDIPPAHVNLMGLEHIMPFERERPVSVAIFGGPDGRDLQHLSGISLLAGPSYLLGIEFLFSDRRSPVRLGILEPNRAVSTRRIDFVIDGPGGERMDSV